MLTEEARKLEEILGDDSFASLPKLVVHNDFGPMNLICSDNLVVGLLDFDFAAWDARVVDLAMALTWLSEDPNMLIPYNTSQGDKKWALNNHWSKSVYHGYCAALDLPLTSVEIRALPYMLRACALSMAVWDLDHKVANIELYDADLAGLLPYLEWLQSSGQEYVDLIVE